MVPAVTRRLFSWLSLNKQTENPTDMQVWHTLIMYLLRSQLALKDLLDSSTMLQVVQESAEEWWLDHQNVDPDKSQEPVVSLLPSSLTTPHTKSKHTPRPIE